MKSPRRGQRDPWMMPNPVSRTVVYALKAMAAGKASEGQQRLALSFITFDLCGVTRDAFDPRDRVTDYALGQQSIGKMISRIIETPVKGIDGSGQEQEIPMDTSIVSVAPVAPLPE